jgi:hypothetical protein
MNDEVGDALARLRACGVAVQDAESARRAADAALIAAAHRLHTARVALTQAWEEFGAVIDVPVRGGQF